jgi:hypothetical protein
MEQKYPEIVLEIRKRLLVAFLEGSNSVLPDE